MLCARNRNRNRSTILNMKDARIILAQQHQRSFKTSLKTSVVSVTGASHIPVITVKYETKWGDFEMMGAPGQSQKSLFKELAEDICRDLEINFTESK